MLDIHNSLKKLTNKTNTDAYILFLPLSLTIVKFTPTLKHLK